MNAKNLFTKVLAGIIALVMVFGALVSLKGAGVSVAAAEGIRSGVDMSPTDGNDPNAILDKSAWLTEDGTYTIELSAFTKGSVELSSIVSTVPVDVILLLDQSYSMADHGTLLGRSFDCYHTTAIKEAATKLVDMLCASSNETVQHRMAIAAYGCENSFLAQYFPGMAGATSIRSYAASELYVGSNEYRYNGNDCSFTYDPSSYIDEDHIGTITAEGIDYFDNGANGGYPYNSAQAHYGEAMRNVYTQKDQLLASINAYDPNPSDPAERGGTAMHVGMKMVEGIMDAYRPNPSTHENMYFKPDADQTPTYHFVANSSSRESWFFENPNGSVEFYVNDPVNGTIANCGYSACPYGDPRFTGSNYDFVPDIFNGNEQQGSINGFYTWIKDTNTGKKVKGNWIRGYWEEDYRPYQMINGVKVYGSWENRKKVVIIFTDGYVGDTTFRPDWANLCMQSAGRIKSDMYGEPATVYTVGLVWDEPEEWIHDRMDVAWTATSTNGLPYSDSDDGLYKNYIHFANYGFQVFNTGEYFPTHFFDSPHDSLLKKFLGYLSSNYIPNAQGQFPTQAVQYIGGYNPTLIVSDHDAGFRNPNLSASYTDGGLFIDNYFIDAHNTLSDPDTADYENIDRLVEAFELISTEIITIESAGGSSASLSNQSVLRDYLSNYFEMPDDFSLDNIKVELARCTGVSGTDYSFGERFDHPSATVGFDAEIGSVSVSNLGLSPCGVTGSGSAYGNKIFVTITGILACSFAVGENLPTNDASSTGIYANDGSVEPGLKFPLPKVDIREKYVVYDFSTLLMEENSHKFFDKNPEEHDVLQVLTLDDCYRSQRIGDALNYKAEYPYYGCTDFEDKDGVFEVSIVGDASDHASFKPKMVSWKDYELGALLKCDPLKNDGVEYEWCKLTFLPATNVHYEEDCLTFLQGNVTGDVIWHPGLSGGIGRWQRVDSGNAVGNQSSANGGWHNEYGYCASYAAGGHRDSNGKSMRVEVNQALLTNVLNGAKWPRMNFTFTGTGFDLISHSGSGTGVFSVDVVPHGKPFDDTSDPNSRHLIVDTYYESNAFLYQIPVLRVVGLEWLEEGYDVVVQALYHPVFDNPSKSGVIEAGTIPGLSKNIEYEFVKTNPECQRHSTKLGEGYFEAYIDSVRVYNPRGENLGSYSGIDYKAYKAANELNPEYTKIRSLLLANPGSDTNALYIDGKDGEVTLEEYRMFGPNNETYLWAAPVGQHTTKAIAFTIANWDEDTRVHISAKAPTGAVRMYVNGEFVADVKSATELYYDITDILRNTAATVGAGHVVVSAEQAHDVVVAHPVISLVNVKVMGQTVTPSVPETATVTFVDGFTGAQIGNPREVRIGDYIDNTTFPTPPDHTAQGYAFSHWDYNNEPIYSDTTITAIYVPQQVTLTVRFMDQVTQQYFATWTGIARGTALNTADFPAAPEHEGYNFIGHSYTEGTVLYADTTIIYEYRQSSGSEDKVIVNLNVNPGHTMFQGTQVLFDKDHNTYGTETIPYYVSSNGQQICYPEQSWYDAAEYLIPENAGPDGPYVESGSQITNFEIDPGTYDLFVLTKQTNGWFWRSDGGHDDLVLTAGMVVNIYYDFINVVVSYGPANSVQPAPSGIIVLPVRGGGALPAGRAPEGSGLRYPIYADIETFNFAEAVLVGVLGDANHDHFVDMVDTLVVMRYASGIGVELDAYGKYCANFNRDGVIDLTDALSIMRSVLNSD